MEFSKNLYYGPNDPEHAYDLANPYEDIDRHLLICIRGGGWTDGSKEAKNFDGGNDTFIAGHANNIAVACINYQHATEDYATAPTQNSPFVLDNIRVAIEQIKAEVRPDRTVILGTSAGANLGMLAHLRYPDLADGFIGFYGAYNLSERYKNNFSPEVWRRRNIFTDNGNAERVLYASPTTYLEANEKRPPSLFYHGDSDDVVSHHQTFLMQNDKDTARYIENESHGFRPLADPYVDEVMDYVLQLKDWSV